MVCLRGGDEHVGSFDVAVQNVVNVEKINAFARQQQPLDTLPKGGGRQRAVSCMQGDEEHRLDGRVIHDTVNRDDGLRSHAALSATSF